MNDMSYFDKPLNARQLEVLHWIADGCRGGIMQGHAHKTSAVALQSRRLAKISRRGGVWTAQITEAGHAYLETGHFPARLPPSSAKPSKTTKPEAAARNSNKEPNAPLLIAPDHWNNAVISQGDDPTPSPVTSFKVPRRLVKPHSTALAYREDRDHHEVSPARLARAVRLVHALATESERRGYELTHSPVRQGQFGSENRSTFADGQFQMIIDGHETRLRLQEKSSPGGKPVPYHPNKKVALWQTMRQTMLVPTGRLMITIIRDDGEVSGRTSKFADGATVRLEDRLPDLLRELEVRSLEAARAQEALRRADQERERRRLEEGERAKVRLREAHRGEVLEEQIKAWWLAIQLREYLVAMSEHVDALEDGQKQQDAQSWLSWSRDYLAKLDPLQGRLAIPTDPVARPVDIKAFPNRSDPRENF